MPITFATDLKDLEKFDYVEQIPVEALFKNLGYKQARYDQATKEMKAELDPLWNIPAIGPDVARKAELIKKWNDHLRTYAGKDLGSDQNARAALESDISQMTNDYEMNQINQRGVFAKQAEAKRRELTKDGSFIADHNDDAAAEVNSYTEYDPKRTFHGGIYKNYDFNKLFKDAQDETPNWDKVKVAGPNQEYFAGKTIGDYMGIARAKIEQDPNAMREKWAEFNHKHAGVDWSSIDKGEAERNAQDATRLYQYWNGLAAKEPDENAKNTFKNNAAKAAQHADFWTKSAGHAAVNPELAKRQAFDDYLDNQIHDEGAARANYAMKETKLTELAKIGAETQSHIKEAGAQRAIDAGQSTWTTNNTVEIAPGKVPAKPSVGRQVNIAGFPGMMDAPNVVQAVENAFATGAQGDMSMIQTILQQSNSIAKLYPPDQIRVEKDKNGNMHMYSVKAKQDPADPDVKDRDLGTFSKNTVYSLANPTLNKEAEKYKQELISNFPKTIQKGVSVPVIDDPSALVYLDKGQGYMTTLRDSVGNPTSYKYNVKP